MTTGKTIALTRWTFVCKVMSLLFNMLSRLVITFLPRSKRLLISWLQSPSAVILEPKKIVSHCFHCFPIYWPWSDGTRCHDLSFLNVEFSFSSFTFIKRLFISSSLSVIRVVSSALSEVIDISPGHLDSRLCFIQCSVSHDVLYCPLFKPHCNWKYRVMTSDTQVQFCNSTGNLCSHFLILYCVSTAWEYFKCFLLTWTTSYAKYLVLLQWWEFGMQVRKQAGKAFEVTP